MESKKSYLLLVRQIKTSGMKIHGNFIEEKESRVRGNWYKELKTWENDSDIEKMRFLSLFLEEKQN